MAALGARAKTRGDRDAAFSTEYQGVPSVEGLTEWFPAYFDRSKLWFDDRPSDPVYRAILAGVDPRATA
jgi:hypothetical protein